MAQPTVLVLTTYPIVKPRHGGQIRARALVDSYREGGFKVSHLAVVDQGAFPRNALGELDIEFPKDDPRWFIEGKNVPRIHWSFFSHPQRNFSRHGCRPRQI